MDRGQGEVFEKTRIRKIGSNGRRGTDYAASTNGGTSSELTGAEAKEGIRTTHDDSSQTGRGVQVIPASCRLRSVSL